VKRETEVTRDSLEKRALRMLSRRDASRQEVSTALRRELSKSRDAPREATEWIKSILDDCEERGYLSNSRLAVNHFAALRRRGSSRRKIEAALHKKGIDGEAVASLFAEEETGAEAVAASRTVARRRFGKDREKFEKELASLARAGFGYDDARRALEEAAKEEE
jgi:regulatory protein